MDNCSFKSLVSLRRGRAVSHTDGLSQTAGWLEAMRVKSRKPVAAVGEVVFAVRMVNQSVDIGKGAKCGKWETAAKILSCSSALMVKSANQPPATGFSTVLGRLKPLGRVA